MAVKSHGIQICAQIRSSNVNFYCENCFKFTFFRIWSRQTSVGSSGKKAQLLRPRFRFSCFWSHSLNRSPVLMYELIADCPYLPLSSWWNIKLISDLLQQPAAGCSGGPAISLSAAGHLYNSTALAWTLSFSIVIVFFYNLQIEKNVGQQAIDTSLHRYVGETRQNTF